MSRINFIVTWGTIDWLEYDSLDQEPNNKKSWLEMVLKQCNITIDYEVTELMQKDSRFIDEADRKLIAKACKASKEDMIIITHWTITMAETAKYLINEKIPKRIVLVGSMIPASEKNSDALFNLGTSISAVQLVENWCYITMNWKVFDWDKVTKNKVEWIFEDL